MHVNRVFWFSHLTFQRALLSAAISVLAMALSTWGQTSEPKSVDNTKQVHWYKYINREYGFSFWYPDTYKTQPLPTRNDAGIRGNRLLLLRRSDNPDARIWISIDIRPFNLHTLAEDNAPRNWEPNQGPIPPPKGQRVGRHVFYIYGGGDTGPLFVPDRDFVKVKGKVLEFLFDGPYDIEQGNAPTKETQQLESKILKTLRTF